MPTNLSHTHTISEVINLQNVLDTHTHTLGSLSNVTIASLVAGQALTWNGSQWVNSDVSNAQTLDGLDSSEFSLASHTHTKTEIGLGNVTNDAQVRRTEMGVASGVATLDGSGLVPSSQLPPTTDTLNDLTDVTLTSLSSGEVLSYNGTAWINNTLAEAGIAASGHNHTVGSLSDVTLTSLTSGQVLSYNGTAWVNTAAGGSGGDADTLDGLDSTQFLRSDVADEGTGKITLTGGFELDITDATDFYLTLPAEPSVGGWARGARFFKGGVYEAGIGLLGSSTSLTSLYLGVGASPHVTGIQVEHPNGNVSITGPTSTIGATTFDNGWLKIGTSANGLAMDPNEVYFSGNTGIIGTLGAYDLLFQPNASAAMRIYASGSTQFYGDIQFGSTAQTGPAILGGRFGTYTPDVNFNGFQIVSGTTNKGYLLHRATGSSGWPYTDDGLSLVSDGTGGLNLNARGGGDVNIGAGGTTNLVAHGGTSRAITTYGDINIRAPSTDVPDIVWQDSSGTEVMRIWNGSANVGNIRFSSSDPTKTLIHSGNIANQNVNYATTSGSANTLDGIDSTMFLRSNVNDSFTGWLSVGSTDSRSAGIYGTYDSYRTAHIWSMGTAYRIPDNGSTFGNLYGLAYKHTNNTTGGTMAGGHQMVWVENGVGKSAMGTNIWTSGNMYVGSNAVIHAGNISAQSVSYATNAGNAGQLDNIDSSAFLRSNTSDSFTSGTLTVSATLSVTGTLRIPVV